MRPHPIPCLPVSNAEHPVAHAAREIELGELVPVLEKFSPLIETLHLYYPTRTMMAGKLRALADFMRAQ